VASAFPTGATIYNDFAGAFRNGTFMRLAAEAHGAVKYRNKGNMARDEIDKTINLMIEIKKSGHFRSFWTTFDQSLNLIASGEVVIQSMISPAVTAVRTRGIPCVFQPLREGYRGWGITLAPMKHLNGLKLDCFYARDGGAFWDRMGSIAVWNTVMDEDRYLTRRWNEFITS
jgi:hypothetical protein